MQADPRPASGLAVDIDPAAEKRQALTEAEQSPAELSGFRSIVERCRIEPHPGVGDGHRQLTVVAQTEFERDAIRVRVLEGVEEKLSG